MTTDLLWLAVALAIVYVPYLLSEKDLPVGHSLPPAECISDDWM